VKREQERIYLMTQKMMRGRVEPFAVPTMVQAIRQSTEIPQMIILQETQLREQRQEVP
jgi:hypothetical protein